MKLDPTEEAIVYMWLRQGHNTKTIASVVTFCRMLDLEIDKFAAMRSGAHAAIEELEREVNPERAKGR